MENLNLWLPLAAACMGFLSALGGSFINGLFSFRSVAPKNATDDRKAFVEGMIAFVNELQEERRALLERLDTQAGKIDALQREVSGMRAHIVELTAHIGHLERQMTERGLTPPSRPVPMLRSPS